MANDGINGRVAVYRSNECTTIDPLFSDGTDIANFSAYSEFWVGVAGNIKFNDWNGATIGPVPVPVGILPWRPRRIWATGTTVTSVIGMK